MKKIIFITLAIITLIIGITGILVNKLKNDLGQDNIGVSIVEKDDFLDSGNANDIIEKPEIPKEKTLDLFGTYDQNDLLIVDKEIEHELLRKPIKIKQISGLKDKDIENKINKNIEDKFIKVLEDMNEIYGDEASYSGYFYNIDSCANFSNVISIPSCVGVRNKDNELIDVYVNLNYNLINGEEIKFKDLFTQDADIQTMIRSALYSKNEEIKVEREYGEDMDWYDENNRAPEPLTENEISKIVQKFTKCEEVIFTFTPYEITIYEPGECTIKFEDFADMVTIYDKYLTEESLYEEENIGFKDIVTCSRESFDKTFLYKKTSYEGENLLYDVTIKDDIYYHEDILKDFTKSKLNECLSNVNMKIEEYETLAQNNPDQMYIVFFRPIITMGTGYRSEYYNLISINYFEKVISGDISEKDELLYKVYSTYRYPHLDTDEHGGEIYRGINNVFYEDYHFDSVDENIEFVVYDTLTENKITDLKDIFKDDVDYRKIIENALKKKYKYSLEEYYDGEKWVERTAEEIEEMFLRIEYEFDSEYIYARIDDDSYSVWLTDDEIWTYLNLQKFTR